MYEIARYCQTNVTGTGVLIEEIQEAGAAIQKVVVASSRAIYGEGKYLLDDQPIFPPVRREADLAAGRFEPLCEKTGRALTLTATDEMSRIHPTSIYGVTKQNQEQMKIGRASCRERRCKYV